MSAPQSAVYGRMPPCVISKAREDLPCLQRVKRARRNRRRMGVCPWQLVAESASFSAADYRAQASGEIFGKIPREFYTVCLATLTAYCPRAAGQRPVRLRSGYAAAPLRVTQKSRAAFFIDFMRVAKTTLFRRSGRLLSRIATKRQCSRARSAPPLPKNLTSLRFSGALLAHPYLAILCLLQER